MTAHLDDEKELENMSADDWKQGGEIHVTEQLEAMGLAGVTSRDQFKALVRGIDNATKVGAAKEGKA